MAGVVTRKIAKDLNAGWRVEKKRKKKETERENKYVKYIKI